ARGEEVELARLGRTDKAGQEPGSPVVTREPHPGKGGREDRVVRGITQVTSQRERQAGTGRGTGNGRDGGLGHLVEPPRCGPLVGTLAVDGRVEGWSFGRAATVSAGTGHSLHVT